MEKETLRARCKNCGYDRNHAILAQHVNDEIDELYADIYDYEIKKYSIIQCLGCEDISFIIVEEFKYKDKEEPDDISRQYPELPDEYIEELFLTDEDMSYLPRLIYDLYEELKEVFRYESRLLAGLGLRTLLEAICHVQQIEGPNLKQKVENMFVAGIIAKNEIAMLDKLRVIGNISAHQMKSIPMNALEDALHIINHVLKSIFIIAKKNRRIRIDKIKQQK